MLPENPCHVLVIKLSSCGDIVHATPCFRALRQRYPHADIRLAVAAEHAPLFRDDPHLSGLIEVSLPAGKLKKLLAIRKLLHAHYPDGIDLALDLQGTTLSAAWAYLSRARGRGGRGKFRPGWQVATDPDPAGHAVEVCARVLEACGVRVPDLRPSVAVPVASERQIDRLLVGAGLPSHGFILLNSFSRWHSKAWPLDRWDDLADRLHRGGYGPLVVTGSTEEVEASKKLRSGSLTSLVGKVELSCLPALLRRGRLLITGDSGPMHVAAALGTPLVALFGPTHPERTGPWGQLDHVVQAVRPAEHHAYRCDPHRRYMRALDVETVHRAVLRRLSAAS